jgi:diguanylate cyclase (GGDEF)-like protein/PAS domain S-box-containing protein
MTSPWRHLSSFTRHLWLMLGVSIVFVVTFAAYVWSENRIDSAHAAREKSFLLAEQLRRSSDELSRLVRTYVATGNPSYKQQFQQILDIRDGRMARPADWQDMFWVRADGTGESIAGPPVSLLGLMERAGFAGDEMALLVLAKSNSDALTRTEFDAMELIESVEPPGDALRARATALLHDQAYYQAKASIMEPINQFEALASKRTLADIASAKAAARILLLGFVLLGWVTALILLGKRRKLNTVLGAPVLELRARIAALGGGDFSAPIKVGPGMENSVLGWLSDTQGKLASFERQQRSSESRNERLTQLYAALIQCNQALVRCATPEVLFDQLCRVIVNYGGMTMAWIGELDETGVRIKPVAAFGCGTAYLDEMHISVDPAEPHGRGPTASAFRDDVPFWCPNFQHDPETAAWHEGAQRYGWASSGALPLRLRGGLSRVLTLYAATSEAFDDDARELLLEMANDIAYALRGFERETERRSAADALRRSEHRMRTIIETEPECVKVVDSYGNLLEMNRAGLAMLGAASLEQVQQVKLTDFIVPQYREAFGSLHKRVMQGESGTLEFEVVSLDGTERWLETHAAPLPGSEGEGPMLLGITRDITGRKQAEQQIRFLAQFDALTGLPNRAQLDSRASYAFGLAQRSTEPVAVMFLGLDHFKDINDSLGHSVGDGMLVELARRLRQVLRVQDTLSRFGGDEFIFLLYGVNARGAGLVARKVLDVVAATFRIEKHELNITGSIGIALYPDDGLDLETLVRNADVAVSQVKQDGRNGYRYFTPEMQIRSARNLQLVHALRQALERQQLTVHYQPQLSMVDGNIIGAEALLRWNHPELGAVSPAEFIPAAEDSGLILPIGEWVLRAAARQARAWIDAGLPPMVMAVNLSAVQFRHPDLPNLVTSILDEEGLSPEYLELELTEGVAMHDPQGAIAMMNKLHERGVRMSIDDFGTGFSSLSHLKKFKVYKLKIDQSFVRDISTDSEDRAIVGAIIHMAKSLGLQTIAEGVETAGQLAYLREQGCDEMQGYFFSRPIPAPQFEELLRSGRRIDPR